MLIFISSTFKNVHCVSRWETSMSLRLCVLCWERHVEQVGGQHRLKPLSECLISLQASTTSGHLSTWAPCRAPCHHSARDRGLNSVSRARHGHSPSRKAKRVLQSQLSMVSFFTLAPPHLFYFSHFSFCDSHLVSPFHSLACSLCECCMPFCSLITHSECISPPHLLYSSSVSYCLSPIYSPHPLKWDWKVPLFSHSCSLPLFLRTNNKVILWQRVSKKTKLLSYFSSPFSYYSFRLFLSFTPHTPASSPPDSLFFFFLLLDCAWLLIALQSLLLFPAVFHMLHTFTFVWV